ncbi:MAG: hypothetical protein ACI3XD_10045 [Oscillospiraceae bacterium]
MSNNEIVGYDDPVYKAEYEYDEKGNLTTQNFCWLGEEGGYISWAEINYDMEGEQIQSIQYSDRRPYRDNESIIMHYRYQDIFANERYDAQSTQSVMDAFWLLAGWDF